MIKHKGLGRGLDALLGQRERAARAASRSARCRVDRLQPGRYQPRTKMDAESLNELAASIKAQGLMQPILVRPAGARPLRDHRRRAALARRAASPGSTKCPVVVRDVPDQAALAMALIENIQREDLNPLEEAQGVQRLVDEFKLTHQEAADAIGRSRAATTNLLRLLEPAAGRAGARARRPARHGPRPGAARARRRVAGRHARRRWRRRGSRCARPSSS